MLKGGSGRKVRSKYSKTEEWNRCPSVNRHVSTFNKLLPICEREKRNKQAFTSARVDISNENKIQVDYEKETTNRGTYRICNLKKIEVCLNDKMCCKCHVNDDVEDFIEHCISLDNKTYKTLVNVYSNYKQVAKRGTIKIKTHVLELLLVLRSYAQGVQYLLQGSKILM